jgi:hypothetical protein
MNLGTSVGYFIEAERADALERAMRRFRADKAREAREALLVSTPRAKTGLGRGARRITKAEAIALIAKRNPRGAFKLQNLGYSKSGGR